MVRFSIEQSLFAALSLALIVVAGCARPLYVQTAGTVGPLRWEAVDLEPGRRTVDGKEVDVYDFTLVVHETRGVRMTFTNVWSTVYGGGWMGGGQHSEKLEVPPFCELHLPFSSNGFKAPLWYVTLRGNDEEDRPVELKIPVALPPLPLQPGISAESAKGSVSGPAITEHAGPAQGASLSQSLTVSERGRLQVVDDAFNPSVFSPFFASDETRKVASLSGVTVIFDPAIPAALHRGLRNMAGGLVSGSLRLNSTLTVPLEVPEPAAISGTIRFTYVALDPRPQACARMVLIETTNSVSEALQSWAGVAMFQQHGFHLTPGWTEREQRALYAVLGRIPEHWLSQIEGLTFKRDSIHPGNLAGEYRSDTHTITMYDTAFPAFDVRFGAANRTIAAIAHELGHAFDAFALRQAAERYQTSLAKFAQGLDGYKQASNSKPSRIAPAAEKLLEAQRITAIRNMEAARSLSGYRWYRTPVKFDVVEAEDAGANGFRRVAGLDGSIPITKYAEKSWSEYFAECFSLYVIDAELLESLRPNIYAYFAKQFPR
jgi:hypothetical protein